MWVCPKCGRIFGKAKQPHSCHKFPLEQHFKNKDKAKELFDCLIDQIDQHIGATKIISLPCCVHLFGKYDFLAALPKKDKLEIRFALNRSLNSPTLTRSVPMSAKVFKNCIDVNDKGDIDKELIGWLGEAYHLKDD